MPDSSPHKRPVTREGIALLIEDCERTSAALSMRPTPFQLAQAVNFLVSTVPAALRNLEEQYEGVSLALAASKENHRKDNEYLVQQRDEWRASAQRFEEQLEAAQKLVAMARDPERWDEFLEASYPASEPKP